MKGQSKTRRTPQQYIDELEEPRKSDIARLDALIRETVPELKPYLHSGCSPTVPSTTSTPADARATGSRSAWRATPVLSRSTPAVRTSAATLPSATRRSSEGEDREELHPLQATFGPRPRRTDRATQGDGAERIQPIARGSPREPADPDCFVSSPPDTRTATKFVFV